MKVFLKTIFAVITVLLVQTQTANSQSHTVFPRQKSFTAISKTATQSGSNIAFTDFSQNLAISPDKKPVPQGKTYNLDYKSRESLIGKATLTTNKAIYKGQEYPVYLSPKGKLFIVYPNKDPKKGFLKKYIKEN